MLNITELPPLVRKAIVAQIHAEYSTRTIFTQIADNVIEHCDNSTVRRETIIAGHKYVLSLRSDANEVKWCLRGHEYPYPEGDERSVYSY